MAEKIRVNVEKVELEVNDNGDIIVLPVSDERFVKRLYDYYQDIQKKWEETKFIDKDNIKAIIDGDIELHEAIMDGFDSVFGVDAYKKVFGDDIVVGIEYVIDFISQCVPFIEAHAEDRLKRLGKYSADRTGSSF